MKETGVKIYRREYFYGRRPVWAPLTGEDGRPVKVASLEEAATFVAGLRGEVYVLRHGEYAAPDFAVKEPGGRIRPVEP